MTRSCSETAGAELAAAYGNAGLLVQGKHIYHAYLAANVTTSYEPQAASLKSDHANCVMLNMAPQQAAVAIPFIRQYAASVKIGLNVASLPASTISALGASETDGAILADDEYPTNETSVPGVAKFVGEMHKYQPGQATDGLAESSWAGTVMLGLALKKLAEHHTAINRATVLATLGELGLVKTGVTYPFSTTHPNSVKTFSRIFDPYYLGYTVSHGHYALTKKLSKFVSGEDVLIYCQKHPSKCTFS